MTKTQNSTGRGYISASAAWKACEEAQADGTLRTFRVKYAGGCACCGKRFRTGQQVLSPEKGKLLGRCCILDQKLWGW